MTSPDLTCIRWHKSTRSNNSQACVEVAQLGSDRAIRDSKNPHAGALTFTAVEWQMFTTRIKQGLLNCEARSQ